MMVLFDGLFFEYAKETKPFATQKLPLL